MQLKEIIVQNIASLKGVHNIKFAPNLFNENLFAITGPTGSGKSTILAAISLGLYGQHYKDKLTTYELITLGEASGSAEVHFQYQGQDYKSKWEGTVLKNNGEALVKPKIMRTIFRLTAQGYEAIDEKIEDILKLSFEQFCKTVILNQGEFNRFITSDFKERKEILERLADNQKLVQMNNQLKKEIRETENEIENKKNWVEGRQHLSDETVQELALKVNNLKMELVVLGKELTGVSTNHRKFQEIIKNLKTRTENIKRKLTIQDQLNGKNKELNEIKQESQDQQKILEEAQKNFLQEEPKLRLAVETLVKKQHQEDNLVKANSNLNQKQTLIKQLIQEEAQLLDSIDQSLKKKKQLTSSIHYKIFTPEVSQMIEKELVTLLTTNQDLSLLDKEYELNGLEYNARQGQKQELKSEEMLVQSQMTPALLTAVSELEGLKKNLDQTVQLISQMESAKVSVQPKMHYFSSLQSLTSNSINSAVEVEKNQIIEKEKKLEFYELALAITHCHDESLKTGHCVVCGNNLATAKVTPEIQQAITHDLKAEKHLITNLKKDFILREDHGQKLIQLLKEYQIEDFTQFDQKLESHRQKRIQLSSQIQVNYEHEKSLARLGEKKQALINNLQKIEQELLALEQKKSALNQRKADKNELKKSKIKTIESYLGEKLADDRLAKLTDDLKISIDVDHLNQTGLIQDKQLKNLNERKISEQLFLQKLQEEITEYTQSIDDKKLFIHNLVGDKDPKVILLERKAKLDTLVSNKNKIDERLHQAELGIKDFEGRLKMSQEQIDALSNLVMSLFYQFKLEANKYVEQSLKLWPINAQYKDFLKGVLENLDLEKSLDTIDEGAIDFIFLKADETIVFYHDHLKQMEKEVIEGDANLKTVADQREQINLTLNIIKEKSKVLNRLKNLYDVIGKDEFRNFILSLVEKQLLTLANNELKNLCNDRYELIQSTKKANQIPEFFVIDKLSGGFRRNIFTLSGGETFLISLAMALGLAEMTRGQAEINSFFIDEGFGTLDQDAIEEVLEVLERMQTTGKQIGVISHIKSLTDRISVNIKLIKNGQGHSSLSFVHN